MTTSQQSPGAITGDCGLSDETSGPFLAIEASSVSDVAGSSEAESLGIEGKSLFYNFVLKGLILNDKSCDTTV